MEYTEKDYKYIAEKVVSRCDDLIIQIKFLKKDYQNIIDGEEFDSKSMPDSYIKELGYWVSFGIMLRQYAKYKKQY